MKHYLEFEKPIVELQRKLDDLRKNPSVSLEPEIAAIEAKLEETRKAIFSDLTPWQRVQLARHPRRPYSLDYFSTAFSGFTELHGDRLYSNDHAIVGGFAHLGDHKVMVIGTQKGRETKENIKRNFGSAHPEGYRKALAKERADTRLSTLHVMRGGSEAAGAWSVGSRSNTALHGTRSIAADGCLDRSHDDHAARRLTQPDRRIA